MFRFLLFSLCCTSMVFAQTSSVSRAQPIDGFAAEVDGTIITVGDVVQNIRPALMALRGRYQGAALMEEQRKAFQDGLEQLIEEQLILAKFRKLGAELPPSAVRERADMVMRERFGDDRNTFQRALSSAGKTEQEWKEELREQLITQSMVQQYVRSPLHIAPREVRAAYESRIDEFRQPVELELSAIAFRPVSEDQAEEQAAKVKAVQALLETGEPFAEVAEAYSEGPKAGQGGDQGWVSIETLPAPLPDVLRELEVGQRSELVETPFQSYIFLVRAKRGGSTMSLGEAQPQIERDLMEEKYDAAYEAWMEGLRDEFQIQRFNPDISAVTGES